MIVARTLLNTHEVALNVKTKIIRLLRFVRNNHHDEAIIRQRQSIFHSGASLD